MSSAVQPSVRAAVNQTDERLERAIGLPTLTASIVNMTIGAGIFVLPAIVAARLGAAAPLAYLVCAGLMGLIVACFAAAGSRVALTGGLYAYIEVAFGPFVGFLTGVLFWLMATFAVASVATAFVGSIGAMMPALDGRVPRAIIVASVFAALALVNVRGVRAGAHVIRIVTAAKLLPLVVLVLAGLWFVGGPALQWPGLPSIDALGNACLVLIFAFAGVEIALVPTGEVINATKTVPRAVFLALACTTTFYLLLQIVAQALLGASLVSYTAAPLAEASARVLGNAGRSAILLGAVVSMFGYLSGDMLSTPRVLYAFGRDGLLPEPFRRVHPSFRTPHVAIAVHAIIITTLAVSSSFTRLAILANVAALTLYGTCVAAAVELQRRDVRSDGATPLRLPGGSTIPVLAIAVIVWLLSHATRLEFAIEALVLGLAAVFYLIRRGGGQA
ncbi:MAG TPA: amino acid permease [Vicinamibacterales bacterium]|jgi:amino acid transporter